MGETVVAPAKINLSLRIVGIDDAGYHLLESLVQTIDRFDVLTGRTAMSDTLEIDDDRLPAGDENLVWKAIAALRRSGMATERLQMRLEKRIPVAAGLGGGSADAAAALRLAGRLFAIEERRLVEAAPLVGADVPFCLAGGLAVMEGRGERLHRFSDTPQDYAVGVAVPPFPLDTARVYQTWDSLDRPEGRPVGEGLPPSLRSFGPLGNDLEQAAIRVAPELADWIVELAVRWERPVLLSGSGPSLFAFFLDVDEAHAALAAVPTEARSSFAAQPVGHGARLVAQTEGHHDGNRSDDD